MQKRSPHLTGTDFFQAKIARLQVNLDRFGQANRNLANPPFSVATHSMCIEGRQKVRKLNTPAETTYAVLTGVSNLTF